MITIWLWVWMLCICAGKGSNSKTRRGQKQKDFTPFPLIEPLQQACHLVQTTLPQGCHLHWDPIGGCSVDQILDPSISKHGEVDSICPTGGGGFFKLVSESDSSRSCCWPLKRSLVNGDIEVHHVQTDSPRMESRALPTQESKASRSINHFIILWQVDDRFISNNLLPAAVCIGDGGPFSRMWSMSWACGVSGWARETFAGGVAGAGSIPGASWHVFPPWLEVDHSICSWRLARNAKVVSDTFWHLLCL